MDQLQQGLPFQFPLWESGTPFAGEAHAGLPRLTIYLPSEDFRTGQGIVICPGGGYGGLSVPKEGHRIARFFGSRGHTTAVLEYRHSPFRHPVPLIDAQRAIRIMRHNAEDWHLDPEQIGILGFSAGGHLAGSAATQEQVKEGLVGDAIDTASSRPDFAVLVYPVVSLTKPCSHFGSRDNLLGKEFDPELAEKLSLENAVTPDTPPTMLIHTNEDEPVPPENSVLFYQALRANNIPAEMHIYEKHGHGIGLGYGYTHPWGEAVLGWLKNRL